MTSVFCVKNTVTPFIFNTTICTFVLQSHNYPSLQLSIRSAQCFDKSPLSKIKQPCDFFPTFDHCFTHRKAEFKFIFSIYISSVLALVGILLSSLLSGLFELCYSEIPQHQAFRQFCHCSGEALNDIPVLKLNSSTCQNLRFLLNSNAFFFLPRFS